MSTARDGGGRYAREASGLAVKMRHLVCRVCGARFSRAVKAGQKAPRGCSRPCSAVLTQTKLWLRRVRGCAVRGCVQSIVRGKYCDEHGREYSQKRSRNVVQVRREHRENKGAHDLLRSIGRLLAGLPIPVRESAQQDIVLAVLSGRLSQPLTALVVRPFIATAFEENGYSRRVVSLDAMVGEQTMGEVLGVYDR